MENTDPASWSRRFKSFFGVGTLAILVVAGFFVYNGLKIYGEKSEAKKQMDAYNAYMDIFRNDTYGGATPEETLKLFVDALKVGDVELASKYFMPNDRGSREKWEKALKKDKAENNLNRMIALVVSAKPYNSSYKGQAWYRVVEKGEELLIDLSFNGKVWKIESL